MLQLSPPPIAPATAAKSPWRWIEVRSRWVAAALLALASAAGVAWWGMHRTAPVQYVTAPLGRGAITRVITATGTVNPMLTVIVGTYVSGVIQNLFCDYNTQVRAGQVCAKIDPRPYQATLDSRSPTWSPSRAAGESGPRLGPGRRRFLFDLIDGGGGRGV